MRPQGNGVGLTIRQLDHPPHDRQCHGADFGHNVPIDAIFQEKPTRFFLVTGGGLRLVICEPCLVVAHALVRRKKKRGF